MTVEVAVMNRMAVALAADSAVTVTSGDSVKMHDSAIKLFMLSKHHPVGVMVYNNASLLGVPWETIVKLFRRRLGNRGFEMLEEYGQELISYLDENQHLFPVEVQEKHYLQALEAEYSRIEKAAKKELLERILYGTQGSVKGLKDQQIECAEIAIKRGVQSWREKDTADYFDEALGQKLVAALSGEINRLVLRVFEGWATDSNSVKPLWELAELLVSKDHFLPEAFSGVVIAGFGENEYFPALQHFEIGGIYCNRLKFRPPTCEKISETNPSIVKAFAYKEMVDSFLYGINPKVRRRLQEAIFSIREMPVAAIDFIDDLSPEQQEHWKQKIRIASEKQSKEFSDSVLQDCAQRNEEIMQAIATLQIKDLAQVAPTLVSLSSFQQHMSPELETVGGPVDVAVISKGDGFIWIERKCYFQRDLNQHFFSNYFENLPDDERDNGRISNKKTQNGDGEND